jgi:osmotically inducible lipoprotein OsmB
LAKTMTYSKSSILNCATLLLALGLTGCASMSASDRNTAMGAGVGAVAGSVLTGGSAVGTIGGAAVGGLIVNEAQKRK